MNSEKLKAKKKARNEGRPRYKKTKVGWIPEEWGIKKGDEISILITKGSSPKWQGFTYQNNGVLFITSENVRNGFLDISIQKYLPKEFNEKQRRSILRYDDILINIVGASIGRACKYHLSDTSANINQAVCLLRPNKKVDSNFISYYLQHPLAVRRLLSTQVDSARPNLTLSDIRTFCFVAPPLPEQKKIAEILSAWDRAIEQVGRLIDAKQRLKKGLMQQLLTGRMRFPEFNHEIHEIHERKKGELPEGWKKVKFGNLFKQVNRKNSAGVSHVLTASGEHGLVDQKDYFNRSVASQSLEGYYHLKRGEFAYNRSAMKGYPYGAIKRLDYYPEGVLSTLYLCFALSSQEQCSDFFMHYFESGHLNRQLRGIVQVGARAHGLLNVTASDFFTLKLPVPAYNEQTRIATLLSTCEREIDLLRRKEIALREQKKGLMQKLLTGEVRVSGIT